MLLEQRVEHLVPAFLDGHPSYLFTFLSTYRAFATTQQALDILFMRYGCFHSDAEEDGGPREQEKQAISSILGTWLDHYPEDFFQPPDFTSLRLLRAYVRVHMPGSELQRRARLLYSWRKHPLAAALEPRPDVPRERAPAISAVPTAASQPRLPEATSSPEAQRVRESETLTAASPPGHEEWTIEGGWMLLEQRVEHLVPAFLGGDPSYLYLYTFLSTYRAFATTQQVLDILFMRYGCFHSDAEEDGGPREQEKQAISSILGTWLDHYPEDFFQPPDFTSLRLLRAYVRVHMPGSELQRRARLLYSWRKHPLAAALEPRPDVPRERAPAISAVPTAASQPRLPEATSSPEAQRVRESETLTAASPPGHEEWTIEGGWMLLEQRVEHLVPAFLGGDPSYLYLYTFLSTYRAFATTQQVLDILFMRYGCFHSDAEEDGGPREQEKQAISSILGTWLDHYPEDFFQPPDFTSLRLLRAYVRVHMPGSELQRRARLLYSWRKHPLAAALEPRPDVPRERAPAISAVPTAASQPRLPEATSSPEAQRVRESETLTAASPPGHEEWTIEGGWMLLEQRVEHLVPAFLGGDPSYLYLYTFLSTYRAFATTQQVLDILFMRYGCFHSDAEEDGGPREQEKQAISSILGTWLDHYPEDFFQPPDFTSLRLLRAYVRVHMPGSELQRRARLLYSWRKHPLAAALEPRPDVPRERAPAISAVPTAASQPRLPEATSSPEAQRVRESETLTAASPPGHEEWTIEGGWMLLEQRVEHLVPAFLGGDPSYLYLYTFLSTYRAFATTQQVLDILFMRYGCFHSDAEEDGGPREQEKQAISSILGTWLDHYPEDFFQPPDFTSLRLLRAYVRVHMPGSELQRRARLLYSWRKHPLAAALEPRPDVPRERAPAISAVPTAASQPRLPEATSSPEAQRVRESETLTAASPPGHEEWTIEGGWMLLEQRVEHLVPAFLGGDPSYLYLYTFLSTYRAFATTQQVLDILFMRYGCFHSDAEEDGGPREQEKQAISSILGTWLDHYPEDFFQPPDFTSLRLLRAYVRVHMPGSELQRRARLLYSWRKHPLAAALEPRPDVPRERAPAISAVPTAALQPRLPEATSSPEAQRVRESETLTAASPPGHEEWTIEGGWMLLEQRVEHLVPAFLGGDPSYLYLYTFLSTYRAFATTQQVLDILFMRYGCFHSDAEEDGGPREQEKQAISSILGTWLDHYPEDFFQPPDFTSLRLLRAYVRVHMPGSELQRRARLLYSWRKHPLAAALEPRPDVPRERAPAISAVPTAASQPRLPEATSSPEAQRVRESETLTAASPPGHEVLPALADSQELEEPPAPLVAPEHEQPSAPAGGVTEGLEQPPAAAEQPASAPQQRLMSAAAPNDEFPDLFVAFFLILVVGIEVFSVLMYYWFILKT
ncbi:uncharacterized protein LOC123606212 [Leopardus geoffroyi]|uniref:uncharacterized protein LOC123606212 n=1 Tax=Leopardus geoffroyi TaxID=46844 RepID=UPI001E265E4F|nr:uncharacterized protein LOC123606212 [Leopardus geoffroyi]